MTTSIEGHAERGLDVSGDPPTVSLALSSIPENLTLVRGMLGGVGDSLGMDPELLDDLKTAVSEAANNVVMHAYAGEAGPLHLDLYARTGGIEAVVRDQGSGMPDFAVVGERPQGVGVPVIEALAEEAEFLPGANGGTEVRMLFAGTRDGRPLFGVPAPPAPNVGWTSSALSGDAVVSLSPVTLLSAVLGRLARALAASARFSLDRFSDVYLVTDAIAAHATRSAASQRIGFALEGAPRRLEITIGPFREGSGESLRADEPGGPRSPLVLLSDELETVRGDSGETLSVLMIDHRR
jgi:anti-sigma regulatory factor (Ser/Thr protein kinase)